MPWDLNGNAGTDPSVDWLGTNDPQPLVIKVNGTEALRIDAQGHVGVGTQTPAARFEVAGNWDGSEGALRLTGDKPTLKLAGGPIAGNQTWIIHVGSDGPGNLDIFKQGASPTAWDNVMTLTPSGTVGIGTRNPAGRANGKLVVEVQGGSGMAAVVGVNDVANAAAAGNGGWFESVNNEGVRGWAKNLNHGGVVGINSAAGIGVYGQSAPLAGTGVAGDSAEGVGTSGRGKTGGYFEGTLEGVHAICHGGAAGFFDGNVVVTGDLQLTGADYAEDFDVVDSIMSEPGTVMVLDDSGGVRASNEAYDRRVAGVVSGAGDFKPAVILDRYGARTDRRPLALMGKVYCMVDATAAPIAIGDLLTTSSTPGHAMKASDPSKAFGAVIGKSLRPLASGRGLVPILVALQ